MNLVQHGQEVYNLRPRWRLPERQLGGTPRAAALHHLLNLVHKRGSICAFKGVFPPLAPQRSTALPTSTPAFTFQARYFLCCLTGSVTLLLLVIISYPFPSTRNFSVTAVPGVSTVALTVGLPEAREPALSVAALDHLAGVKQVFFFVTKDTAMALQALTAVGEGIDGQAGAMYAFVSQAGIIGSLVTERPHPPFLTFTGEA